MLTVLTLHRVTTPSSLAILANALKTLVYPLRSSGGSLRERQSVTFTFVHHITLYMLYMRIPAYNCTDSSESPQ